MLAKLDIAFFVLVGAATKPLFQETPIARKILSRSGSGLEGEK